MYHTDIFRSSYPWDGMALDDTPLSNCRSPSAAEAFREGEGFASKGDCWQLERCAADASGVVSLPSADQLQVRCRWQAVMYCESISARFQGIVSSIETADVHDELASSYNSSDLNGEEHYAHHDHPDDLIAPTLPWL